MEFTKYLPFVSLIRGKELKQSNSLYFKPFKPLANYSYVLSQIEDLIAARDYKAAMKLSQNLISLSLSGLHYFQTYDWLMLMATVTLGYVGWMVNLILHVLQSYTYLPRNDLLKKNQAFPIGITVKQVRHCAQISSLKFLSTAIVAFVS